jgi:hypothetical protein
VAEVVSHFKLHDLPFQGSSETATGSFVLEPVRRKTYKGPMPEILPPDSTGDYYLGWGFARHLSDLRSKFPTVRFEIRDELEEYTIAQGVVGDPEVVEALAALVPKKS